LLLTLRRTLSALSGDERHFTKNRTWKGTDHAASLEPGGMERLVRDLNNTWKCMSMKEQEILPIEEPQRSKLKWGFYNKASTATI
jgi:N-acetylneuraminate synthase